eukprot:CAMPEP_0171102858 /NCGR_PEP_ID=MMETSP0766_2-20121228/58593_1 /TAXON_ID=439317 /ORGANISM="Gambierdiscus australes, Strain CAWD 149" /LENGTH=186 /DNA_ID=CAMNT_0011563219 /DNA_START=56 /DNA_END=616 /DNA_ORIENTATION=+
MSVLAAGRALDQAKSEGGLGERIIFDCKQASVKVPHASVVVRVHEGKLMSVLVAAGSVLDQAKLEVSGLDEGIILDCKQVLLKVPPASVIIRVHEGKLLSVWVRRLAAVPPAQHLRAYLLAVVEEGSLFVLRQPVGLGNALPCPSHVLKRCGKLLRGDRHSTAKVPLDLSSRRPQPNKRGLCLRSA